MTPHTPAETPAEEAAHERRSGLRTIRRVAPYLWPDDQPWVKRRVAIALVLLLAAKLVAVARPCSTRRRWMRFRARVCRTWRWARWA